MGSAHGADVRRGEWVDPGLGRVTFGEWAQECLTTIVHLRVITQGDYERALRVHVLPVFGDCAVVRIDYVDVRRFVAQKQAEGLAPKTLQRVRLVLRQVLALAKSAGAIKANPCDGLRLPRPARVEPIFLTADQVKAWRGLQSHRSTFSFGLRRRPGYDPASFAASASAVSTSFEGRSRSPRR